MIFDIPLYNAPVFLCWGIGWDAARDTEHGSVVLIPHGTRVQMSDDFLFHMPAWGVC